jgi:hypothetical protein
MVIGLAPALAFADDEANASLYVYADDDETTIVSPRARAEVDLGERASVTASYDADVITAASVDVRTSATPRAFTDLRHGGTLASSVLLDRLTKVGASARGSIENDFDLIGGTLTASRELPARTVTLEASWGLERAWVGRTGDPTFDESLTAHRASGGVTVVLDPRTVLSASYALGISTGFQASPYRFVPIWGAHEGAQGRPSGFVPERLPAVRDRHAVAVELRRVLVQDLFLGVRATGYADGWGIEAATLLLESERTFARDALALRVRARGYAQTAARFHEERYDTWPRVPDVVSADRELGAMTSLLGGLGVRLRLIEGSAGTLSARVSADAMWFHYLDFAALHDRSALLLSAGLEGSL